MARIQSQPQELLYATGAAIKLKKKKRVTGDGWCQGKVGGICARYLPGIHLNGWEGQERQMV